MKRAIKTKVTKRKKKRVTKKEKAGQPPSPQVLNELKAVRFVEYEITTEPIHDRDYKRLPDPVKDVISRLHHEAQRHPLQAIPELVELIEKYPNVPMLYNFLSVAYSLTGQREKMEEVILENYQRNPDYLFARLNYAELCRLQGDYEQIAEIFEHKFDLKLLYPRRKRFHISEVANFMGLIGVYFFETGQPDVAERYYEMLEQIAPDYPMTRLLQSKLHPTFLGRILKRMAGQTKQD